MRTRKLRGLTVSEIGMGCMGFSHGYGRIPDEEYSIQAIRAAYEHGCTFYDTAEVYSPNLEGIGHNERIVGKALQPMRRDVTLATKLFLPTDEARRDGVYATLRHHLEGSMRRLCTDYIDLYYLHHLNPDVPVEQVAEGMGRLIEEGLIRAWGLSNVGVRAIAKAHAATPVSAVQNIYSMMERDCEESVIPYCMEHGIGVVPFSPIASGFLSGKITPRTRFEQVDDVRNVVPQLSRENIAANQPLVEILRDYAARKHATPAQISLAWMLHKYPNVVPIPGSKNQSRILENLDAANVELTADEFASLERALDSCAIHGYRGCVEIE
ncbi:aldo/keto reductase [Bifidobacterium lemurum]|uniref:Aldo/keto reductase n=1 Tax=Bifidobacterium lemurum TaxID=1603886 RepID=A0A261FW52_9BIFI|nr:aldo/keto reductase [Bifidobacterium lemurum]OZG63348.1 aldo/keto reductase [Bifidobacterium lemurum]QOL34259.1 aldo/keto reductase [Bifidobacterium lemurum]